MTLLQRMLKALDAEIVGPNVVNHSWYAPKALWGDQAPEYSPRRVLPVASVYDRFKDPDPIEDTREVLHNVFQVLLSDYPGHPIDLLLRVSRAWKVDLGSPSRAFAAPRHLQVGLALAMLNRVYTQFFYKAASGS